MKHITNLFGNKQNKPSSIGKKQLMKALQSTTCYKMKLLTPPSDLCIHTVKILLKCRQIEDKSAMYIVHCLYFDL